MTIKTKKIKTLSKNELKKIKIFLIKCFPDSQGYEKRVYSNPELETCILLFNNGRLIGHASITKREVRHRRKKYLIGGLGDIAVTPKLQRKGFGTMILKAANKIIKKEKYDLGLLFCHPKLHDYYHKQGWIKKYKERIYYTEDGDTRKESTSYFLPVNLSPKDTDIWLYEEIHIGEGTW